MVKLRLTIQDFRISIFRWYYCSHWSYCNDGNGNDAGHVRIYEYSSGSWTQLGADIDGEAAGDHSGSSVSLSSDGTRVAIGAALMTVMV